MDFLERVALREPLLQLRRMGSQPGPRVAPITAAWAAQLKCGHKHVKLSLNGPKA